MTFPSGRFGALFLGLAGASVAVSGALADTGAIFDTLDRIHPV